MTPPPLDRIHISDLKARCIIGINDDERRERQDVNIQITLWADLRKAGQSDDIADTVNYRSIKKAVFNMVEQSRYYLIEKLAQHVADLALAEPQVAAARVRVEKPGALRFARTVAVEIDRRRDEG